jgi:Gram-negative bacterial TonB protein C-terminal
LFLCFWLILGEDCFAQKTDGKPTKNELPKCDFSNFKTYKENLKNVQNFVLPQLSQAAKDAKLEGKVKLKMLVNKQGKVFRVCAMDGNPKLVEAATEAAMLWTYPAISVKKILNRKKRDYVESIYVLNFTR